MNAVIPEYKLEECKKATLCQSLIVHTHHA